MLERQENVRSVKLGSVLLKATDLAQVEEQFATRAVLKAEVKLALSLERVVHLDNELMVYTFLYRAKYIMLAFLHKRAQEINLKATIRTQ